MIEGLWYKLYDRFYLVTGVFKTDEEANAFMQANPGQSLLAIENGQRIIAHKDDAGLKADAARMAGVLRQFLHQVIQGPVLERDAIVTSARQVLRDAGFLLTKTT